MFAKTLVLSAFAALALAIAAPAPRKEVDDSSIDGTTNIASFYDLMDNDENGGFGGQVACPKETWPEGLSELSNNALIVAMKGGEHNCGKKVIVTNLDTGKEQEFSVVDECTTCKEGQLDIPQDSWRAFSEAPDSLGELNIKWRWA